MFRYLQHWSLRSVRALLLITVFSLSACSLAPPKGVQVVSPFELERYLGTWYEIARLDHSFERGLDNVKAKYSLQPDGSIQVINSGYTATTGDYKEAIGVARFRGSPDVGSLKVSFFRPFYGGYHLVALDEQYRWAMVIGPNRNYFWILAREKQLPEAVRLQLLEQATELGVEVSELIWVVQDRADG